jgi:diguanylate cyclase
MVIDNETDEIILTEDLEIKEELDSDVKSQESWNMIIIDDEPAVHQATQLALRNFTFENKSLSFFSAYSELEAQELLTKIHQDTALILLDVVMETDDAGLKLVHYVRENLKNRKLRIILRTGHPGEAPEESVLLNYDINDYKLKVELTRRKLRVTAIAALRSYRDIITIEKQRIELSLALENLQQTQTKLEEYSRHLEYQVAERTAELVKANQELSRLANLDGLTLIANRRCFDTYLEQQWNYLGEQQQFLSLLFIDVDYFKKYNDYYGHQAGDECLKQVAQTIAQTSNRMNDLVARYGGEEFALLLPYTSIEGAIQVAQKIRREISKLQLKHEKSLAGDFLTLSIGISSMMPQKTFSCTTLIATADTALYQAKQKGRNCYSIYSSILEN